MAVETKDIVRPSKDLMERLSHISAATAAGSLSRLGIRDPHLRGLVSWTPGKSVVGPALTLQFMPKREDVYQVGEYSDPEVQLHRHSLYHTQPGDIIVVDARGHMGSGVFGDMMLTFFRGRGGAGAVIDGCIRDYPKAKELGIGLWLKGVTPNYHTQTDLFPYAVNVPVAVGETYVAPGDIIVADDDGAVVVPISLAEQLVERATTHHEWEEFSRMRLMQGGHLRRYYPLHADARPEFEAWKAEQEAKAKKE
jgi:regulator of RNase E activity RraA